MDGCEHFQCQSIAARAAWLASADTFGAVTFIDESRAEPGLRPFSVDCNGIAASGMLYMRDNNDQVAGKPRFWALRLTEVTDPALIARLEEAARADEPVTGP